MIALCKLAFNTSARRELIKKCSQCCFNEKVKHRPKWAELLIAWIKPILQQIISLSHSSCCFILMSMLQDIRINSDQNRVHTSTRRVRKGYQWSRENWKCFPSQAIDLKSQNKQLSRRVKKHWKTCCWNNLKEDMWIGRGVEIPPSPWLVVKHVDTPETNKLKSWKDVLFRASINLDALRI